MTSLQAAELATKIREAFPAWGWSDLRYSLYVENFEHLPYTMSAAVVAELVHTWPTTQAPAVGKITELVEARRRRALAIAEQRRDRLLLAGPKDPAVRRLLRDCIRRLEHRASAGGA